MASHFTLLDWCVLAAYFVGTMGIGLYFYRRTRTREGFTAANHSLPGWVCGLSIFATYLSSISYLALPGKSFADNWNPFVFSLALPIATWIAVRWFLPYYRRSGEVSAYALLEHRFGAWARVYASTFYLLTQIARIGIVMYLMALPLAVIFGWDIRVIIVVTGLSVTLYAFVGGIVGVIWADAIQAIVLMVGAVVCLVVMLLGIDGGPGEVFRVAAEQNKFSLGSFRLDTVAQSTFWVVLIYGLFINLQNFGIDQSYIQRYISSRDDREARKSLWLGGLLYIPVSALFFFIGTALFVYYTTGDKELPDVKRIVAQQRLMQSGVDPVYEQLPDGSLAFTPDYKTELDRRASELTAGDVGDRVFPHFIAKHLPPGLTGLLIAAIFAAAMSTVSTSLNSSATLVMNDYYVRFFKKGATERQCMLALYAGTVAWGVLGTAMALVLVRLTESALDMWWSLASVFSGGMLGLFLLGMISRHARNPAAVTAVLIGFAVIAWMVFSPTYFGRVDGRASLGPNRTTLYLDGDVTPGQINAGDTLLLSVPADDAAGDSQARRQSFQVASVSPDGRILTLVRSYPLDSLTDATVYRDNLWHHLRSRFHSFMVIVVGSLTILLVGIFLTRLFGGRVRPVNSVANTKRCCHE
ncbi:MAG: sodium:solute symporter [Sedimentisphaerales bacterium]|nr:sodium:solute symporter [Sedimentisphaerales bacterium]